MDDRWRVDLGEYLLACTRKPHRWGTHDCVAMVAGGVMIKQRVDYFAQFRGQYSDYAGALALLREIGFEQPVDYFAHLFSAIPPIDAGDGDIAAVEGHDGTIAFGLFMRQKIYVTAAEGMGLLSRTKAFRAFEVQPWYQFSPPA